MLEEVLVHSLETFGSNLYSTWNIALCIIYVQQPFVFCTANTNMTQSAETHHQSQTSLWLSSFISRFFLIHIPNGALQLHVDDGGTNTHKSSQALCSWPQNMVVTLQAKKISNYFMIAPSSLWFASMPTCSSPNCVQSFLIFPFVPLPCRLLSTHGHGIPFVGREMMHTEISNLAPGPWEACSRARRWSL